MDITAKQAAEILKNSGNGYRIIYHIRPDGDAICSAYALAEALHMLGKKCGVISHGRIPSVYSGYAESFGNDDMAEPLNVVVDSASPARIGGFADEKIFLSVDHHMPNTIAAEYKYTDAESSSCGELVYKMIKELGVGITPHIAELIFTALLTDTFCFRSGSVNADSYKAAAELACCGIDVSGIARRHYMNKSPQRAKIEEIFVRSYHYTCGGKVLGGIITREDMRVSGIDPCELEGITSFPEEISGVLAGITIRETADGRSRVSVHTSDGINAADICGIFGGGGHAHAAGCELDCAPDEALKIIEKTCAEMINSK